MSLHKSNTAWSWWARPSYLCHCNCDWLSHTTWSNRSCRRIPRGMAAAIWFPWTRLRVIGWTIPRGSTRIERYPVAWNLSPCCFIFLHNTVANMLCRLFDDRKYMDIYLPIPQEYCYLGKQKNSLHFLVSTCEHLWPSPSHLVNFSNWLIGDIFTGFVWTFCTVFFKVY